MQLKDRLGICQWFHFEDFRELDLTLETLHALNVRHLRTGISWADYLRPGGKKWYDHQMSTLQKAGVEVLLSVWHTPPSLGEAKKCSAPPRRLQDYADFLDLIITDYGSSFSALELWNEPNNRYKWDFIHCDPDWRKFGEMITYAAFWARHRGVKTVLGGMAPIDHHWLELMQTYGALEAIDVVGIHAFPNMWWDNFPNWEWFSHWKGWEEKIESIAAISQTRPVWITETGLATWDLERRVTDREELQVQMLHQVAQSTAERIYWYSVVDLDPRHTAIEGFHVDENEYHMGLVDFNGHRKPAFYAFKQMMHNLTAA